MKRNFKLLVAVVVLVATVFTLASCAAIQGFIDKLKPQPPVHEHTFSEEWSYDETNHWHAATCTDTEECATATSNVTAHSYYANGHCSVCGAVDPEYVPPVPECTEHSYSVEETKAPTCTEEGEKTFTCDECGYSYTQAVAALGHTEEKVAGTAPTCTETGLSDGKVCTVCGETTKAQTAINATGHNYVEGTCSACGAEDPDYNGVRTYVLDVQTLTAFAQGDKADGAVFEYDSFYTIYYSAKTKVDTTKNKTWPDGYTVAEGLRLNWGGTTAINDDVKDEEGNVTGYVTKNAIKIVVNGTATVKVWWNCGGDGREIGIFDENGELVVASQTDDVFTEGTEGVGAGKNNNYLSELTISKPGTYYIGTDNTNAIKNGGNIIFKVETKVTPVEEEPSNEIEATTTDNNCWVDKVTFTADGEGKYTFTLPAGLGAWEATDCDTFPPVNGPYVDYYDNLEGATFTVGLEAGATLEFYIGSTTKQDWVIEWSYEACDVEEGGSTGGDDVIDNEELAMGENSVVFGEEHITDGKDYTFVVTEAGTYTFASDSILAIVMDSTGMQIGRYEVSLEAGTYTVKLISMAGAGTYSVNVTVATAGGDDDDTPTEPDGSETNPYVWDTLPESTTADGDSINMIFYTFTATENGVLNITYATANSWIFVTDKTDPSLSDSASNKDVNSFNIVAGHVYVIGLGVWNAEDSDPTVTISLGAPIDPDSCEHEWSEVWYHEDIVDATCTTPGVAVFCCEICGTYKTEATEIDPDGHDYVTNTETYVEPTCQTDGYREATCSYCNDHQEYVLSSEEYGFHDMVVEKEEYATCTTGGCYIAHCQTEGCDYSVNETSDPNGHYNYTVVCGQSGECLECGETFTKEHDLLWSPATCTEAAFCWDCNTFVGEPLGHTPGDAATCDTPQICTVCEEVIAEPAHPAITHVEAKAATCFENGNIEYWYCETCGYAWLDEACTQNTNLKAVILPMAHAPATHVEAVAATCFEEGNIEYWYCAECGQAWLDEACTLNTNLKSVILPVTHAGYTHVEAKAATCFEEGNIEYWYCTECGYAWLDELCTQNTNLKSVILPVTHTGYTHVEAKAATCFEEGNIEYWYCTECGYAWLDELCTQNTNLKSVILPVTHAGYTHVEAVEPTCYENGNIEYWYCEDCGFAWLDELCTRNTNLKAVVLPMAHAPATHVEAVAATCTENGNIEYWYCAECGQAWLDEACTLNTNVKAVVLPTLAHTGYEEDFQCDACSAVIAPEANSVLTIEQALTLGALYGHDKYTANKYYVTGMIKSVYNTTYGNMYIVDAAGNELTVYGTYSADGATRYDKLSYKPTSFDEVTVYGIIGQYNGTAQMKNGWIDEVVVHEHKYVDGVCSCGLTEKIYTTIPEAIEAIDGSKIELTGTVISVEPWNAQYGNMNLTIEDAEGNSLYIFRCSVQVGVGDVITVTGVMGTYNDARQVAKDNTVVIVEKHVCSEYTDATCSIPATCVICGSAKDDVLADHNFVDGVCSACGTQAGVSYYTASKTIAELIVSEGWTNTTTKQQFKLDDNVTCKVNGGSNSGKAYDGTNIRLYATDSPAGTLTITVPEGYELVSVKVTTVTGTYAFLYAGNSTTDISNVETEISGNSVVLKAVKNGSNGKQVRVTAIEVVYKTV